MHKLTSNLELKREITTRLRAGFTGKEAAPASVSIEYCVPGNYHRVAAGLSDAVEAELGQTAELIPSRDGVFEVSVHGRVVFSKRACSRFPDHEEVLYHLRNS